MRESVVVLLVDCTVKPGQSWFSRSVFGYLEDRAVQIDYKSLSCVFICSYYIHSEVVRTKFPHKMLKRPYERISFTAITMVVLALSLVVWPASFVPGFFIIPFRPGTRFMASSFEGEWWRNAHFSTIEFLEESTTIWQNYLPLLQIHYEYSDTRNMNRIPSGNILCSMGGVSFIHQY